MSNESQAPVSGLPDFDAKADRGSEFIPEGGTALVVELSADELKAIGKGEVVPVAKEPANEPAKEPAKEPVKATEPAPDKGDKVTEPVKEPVKEPAAKAEDVKDPAAKAEDVKDPAAKVEDDKPRDKEGKFIPKARFDEVNNKAKAKVASLEAANAALEARLGLVNGKLPSTVELETSLTAKTVEYSKLVADGQLDDANAVMADINKINRQIGNIEAAAIAGLHGVETQNVATLTELVDLYKGTYPQFDDTNKEAYNQDHVDYVADLQARFEKTGSSPAEALREAVEIAVLKFGMDPEPETAATPAAAAVVDKGAERKEAAVDKAVKAAVAQPASTSNVGIDSDKAGMSKVSIEQLSDFETFNALAKNESTLKRLRGDIA